MAENSHPALRSLATKNAEIAEHRIQTAAGIERLAKSIKEIGERSKQFEAAFKELQEKVEHAGKTSSTGVLLLKQRDELPPPSQFQSQATFVQKAMPEAHLKLLELNQLRREISDPAEMAGQMLSSFSESLANYDQQQVLEAVTGLLTDRRDFLDKASIDQNTYLQDLNDLELANQALANQVHEFRQYLDQRVMWIRSAEPIRLRDLKQAFTGMATLASPSRWLEVLRLSGGELLRRPAGAIAVISLFLLLLLGRARLMAIQNRLTEPVAADQIDSYLPKVVAFLIAVVLSARWPLLLLAVGIRLKFAASRHPLDSGSRPVVFNDNGVCLGRRVDARNLSSRRNGRTIVSLARQSDQCNTQHARTDPVAGNSTAFVAPALTIWRASRTTRPGADPVCGGYGFDDSAIWHSIQATWSFDVEPDNGRSLRQQHLCQTEISQLAGRSLSPINARHTVLSRLSLLSLPAFCAADGDQRRNYGRVARPSPAADLARRQSA